MKTLQLMLSIVMLSGTPLLTAQQTILPRPESQPVWTVEDYVYGVTEGYWHFWYGTTQTICEEEWTELLAQGDCGEEVLTLGYLHEADDQVWVKGTIDCTEEAVLLYDFTLEPLDTFYLPVNTVLRNEQGSSRSWHRSERRYAIVLSKDTLTDATVEIALWNPTQDAGDLYWRSGIGASNDPFRVLDYCRIGISCHYHPELECLSFGNPTHTFSEDGYFDLPDDCTNSTIGGRLYVNAQAEGAATGYDWANAFTDLPPALAAASCGTEIWVAEGTYLPSATDERSASFRIPSGVRVYGGFQGTETNLAQRDYTQNLTLLSGELGDTSLRTDNSYHVVTFLGTDTTTVLDGFTISGGYAVATPNPDVPVGGGILAITDEDNPLTECRIENCQIVDNTAEGGGGVACIGYPQPGEDWRAYPRFKNCAINNNYATSNGGGLYFRWLGHPRADVPLLEDCVVRENRADNQGGGLYVDDLGDHLYLRGTAIEANSTELDGGGIFAYQILGQFPSLSIDSCSISYNEADAGGALYYPSILTANYQDAKTEVIIHHSGLIGNVARSEGGALYCDMGGESIYQFDIAHSTFENNGLLNQTGSDGAVAYLVFGDNADVLVEVDHSSFIGNTHNLTQEGRGIIQLGAMFGYAEITSRFTNCLFADNVMGLSLSSGIGGAIQENTIANCTFYNNGPKPCVTSWNPDEPSQNHTLFYNNVVWEPQAENPVRSGFTSLNSVSFHHNLFSSLDCTLPGGDTACGEGNIIGIDPLFIDAAGGDFRTATCSPARNSGSMAAINELGLLTDLAGEARLLDGRVDMGAYEQAAGRWSLAGIAPVTCYGSNSGSVQLDTLHVALPAQAQWLATDGNMGSGFDNLPAGMLDLWLEDALGCRDTFSITIPGPTPIQFSSTLTNATTAQSMDGGIAVFNLTGGQPPYQYVWSTGDTTATLQAIPAGDYELSITDALGCTVDYIFTVDHTTGVSELLAEHGVRLYPNPMQAGQSFQLSLAKSFSQDVGLQLVDVFGRHIATYILASGLKEKSIPAPATAGTYVLLLSNKAGQILGHTAVVVD